MSNLFALVIYAGGFISVYEFIIRPFFKRREIKHFEKLIDERINQMSGWSVVVDVEPYKKEVLALRELYYNINFNDDHVVLKFEIAKLLLFYVFAVDGVIIQRGKEMCSDETDDSYRISMHEKHKLQLSLALNNLLAYVKDITEEE